MKLYYPLQVFQRIRGTQLQNIAYERQRTRSGREADRPANPNEKEEEKEDTQ